MTASVFDKNLFEVDSIDQIPLDDPVPSTTTLPPVDPAVDTSVEEANP